MTSRAGQARDALLGLFGLSEGDRESLNEIADAIEQEVRDEIRAVIEAELALASDTPDAFESGSLAAYNHVLAAISSSSATETQDEQPDWETPEQTERRIARDSAWTPLRQAATETQDGERHEHEFTCLTCDARFRKGERVDGDAARALAETQDGERPGRFCRYVCPAGPHPEHPATPTPDDRNREVERIAVALHDATPPEQDGGVPDVCNRYDEHEALAAALYDAGLRASGGTE